jgi:hypothetical protein
MDQQDVARFETEAAEIIGAMKELFKEFENRIGEVVSVQRVSASEARNEGAQTARQLQELTRLSRSLVDEQRNLLARIEREWQLRIDSNAQRAGEAQAKAFGESIAHGLEDRLTDLASQVEVATRRYTWKSAWPWAFGVAFAIPLTAAVCLNASSPGGNQRVPDAEMRAKLNAAKPAFPINLSEAQAREALSKLSLCQVQKTLDWHACIEVDSPPHIGFGGMNPMRVAIRGM